jgi:hypothetical protein
MDVDLSHLSGHILILGVPASQDGLLSLLAALRSQRLLQWRPVVIIDSAAPRGGGSWEAVAQFSDVYFIQVRAWARQQKLMVLTGPVSHPNPAPADSCNFSLCRGSCMSKGIWYGSLSGARIAHSACCDCVQSAGGLNDALLRASAEHAAQAILMSPLVSHDYDNEDQRLASRVMTGT